MEWNVAIICMAISYGNKVLWFWSQENYESPLVAVQFNNPKLGQLLHVECRAWAKNIDYDKRHRMGISHFELYILNDAMAASMENFSWTFWTVFYFRHATQRTRETCPINWSSRSSAFENEPNLGLINIFWRQPSVAAAAAV